jgi:hypothetical protein
MSSGPADEQMAAFAAQLGPGIPSWAPGHTQMLPQVGGDLDDLGLEMLRAIEAEQEAAGWDRPHQVGLLMAAPARGADPACLVAVSLDEPIYGEPARALTEAARWMVEHPRQAVTWVAGLPGKVLAVVVSSEAWTLPDGAVPDGRCASERDDRVEKRLVLSVDLDGDVLAVQRVRGGWPQSLPRRSQAPRGLRGLVSAARVFAMGLRLAQEGYLEDAARNLAAAGSHVFGQQPVEDVADAAPVGGVVDLFQVDQVDPVQAEQGEGDPQQ